WDIVWTTIRYPRGHLRTIPTDKLVRKVVRKIHSRRHRHGAVGIGTIANYRSAIGQNTGARQILAQPIANVRIIKIEHTVAQDMREHGCWGVSAFCFPLEHTP